MWLLYDELIAAVPGDLRVTEVIAGLSWFAVSASNGCTGMAMTPREGNKTIPLAGKLVGRRLREVAQSLKSWNNYEAALGLAAVNAHFNAPEKVASLSGRPVRRHARANLFDHMQKQLKGKKVAVVGHFRGLEKLAQTCRLSILERFPLPGDYPDPACEYILPGQDYVFITGTTLINKTLPRLLQLSRKAFVSVVGPSTPLTPILFKHGVDIAAGTVVMDSVRVRQLLREGDQHGFFEQGGHMVKIYKDRHR